MPVSAEAAVMKKNKAPSRCGKIFEIIDRAVFEMEKEYNTKTTLNQSIYQIE
ncbi:hypothetical protein C943_00547 [Mariniradius saccharolyticus AK6]|uniref:Uncharacterized protein n=1 Tax=Mariniradius saccharolyticus AK6 TaxID=1239962 RepID=M7XEF7_9BACT|nr:hypothetical protein C943_00547 [Mariniradius saccharolyticus AK6]